MSWQNLTAICFDLYRDRAEECCDILLAFYLTFLSQHCFLCNDIILALIQEIFRQCRNIKIHCHDIIMSSNFHYVATLIHCFVATFLSQSLSYYVATKF